MQSFTLDVSCPVITVSPTTLANGVVGTAYGPVAFGASGGSGSYAFTLTGTPPPGLAFTGASLGGTPTDTGTFTFSVVATDTVTGCAGSTTFNNVIIDLVANNDDLGTIVGNVLVNSALTPFSVATNDQLPPGATITAFDAASVHNGTVTMVTSGANIGQFTYLPARGYEGTDSFTYTVAKNGRSATATVSATVSGMVWFVDNSAGSCPVGSCDGRQGFPYTTLDAFRSANAGLAPAPQPNHSIYLATGSGAYTVVGTLTLRTGQQLIGQGAASTFASASGLAPGLGQSFPAVGGTFPNANASISYTTNTKLVGFDMDGTATALSGNAITGFTVNLGRFRRTAAGAGAIVSLSGAGNTGSLTFRSVSVTGTTGITNRGVSVQNLTGSFTVSGTDTGVTPNGGTITGHGGNGMEFIGVATCGTVGTCSGNSVSLANMTLNANAQSQSVAGSSASCGGAITTGTNTACVANLFLQNVDGVSINGTSATNSAQMGINGNNVYDFAMTGGSVTGNGNEADENGILFQNLHGTSSITSAAIHDNVASQVVVGMTSAGLSALTLTVSAGNFTNTSTNANRTSGFVLTGAATGTTTLNITGSSFANNGTGDGLEILAGTTTAPLNVNGQIDTSTFATSVNGVSVTAQASSNVAFHTVNNGQFTLMNGDAILYQTQQPATGTLQGRITGNSIGASGAPACVTNCGGIAVGHFDGGANTNASTVQVTISGNNLQRITNGYAIDVSGQGAGSAHTKIASNTIGPATGDALNQQEAIDVNYATTSGSTIAVCSDVTANAITDGGVAWGAGITGFDMHLRARFATSIRLPGFAGAPTDTTAVQNFEQGNNGGASVFAEVQGGGTYAGGASCTTP